MRRALLALLLLALLCPATAGAAKRSVPRGWLGAVADGPMTTLNASVAGDWHLMKTSGVENVRTAFYWPYAQPSPGAAFDFSRFDIPVLAAAREGLPVLPVIEGTPGWAASRPGDETSPPADPQTLDAFVRALGARYGPGGTLWAEHPEVRAEPVRAWQVGNEPNLRLFFNPPEGQSYAKAYVGVLRTARRAILATDPKADVVLAGLTNKSWLALRAIYKAGGRKLFDAAALHPYTAKPSDVVRVLERGRREMKRAGDRRKPLWITELSWPASRGKAKERFGFATTDQGQAARLKSAVRLLAKARKRLKLARVYWYTWMSTEGDFAFQYSGLRRVRAGQVIGTPALAVFRREADRLYGRR